MAIRVHEQVSDGVAMGLERVLHIGGNRCCDDTRRTLVAPFQLKEPPSASVTCTAWCEWNDVFGYGGSLARFPSAQRQAPSQNTMRPYALVAIGPPASISDSREAQVTLGGDCNGTATDASSRVKRMDALR